MTHINKILLSIIFLVATGLSLSSDDVKQHISIENAYVREVPPSVPTSASFLTLSNNSDREVALIKATSEVAENVELHEHTHNNGMMEMRQVQEIIIPAKGTTVLKPGGFHIMLIGLTRKIAAGDTVEISLEFDDGSKKEIEVQVKQIMNSMKKM